MPSHIQWMPPGRQPFNAGLESGKRIKGELDVTAAAAERVNQSIERLMAKADAGQGDRPYLDFNHEDGEASAWVKAAFWGGDDPKDGGVRLRVDWTDVGAQAVRGKRYRRFSPQFGLSQDGSEVVGAPVNMGGFVNRAGFRQIASLFAKDQTGGEPPKRKEHVNEEELKAKLAATETERDEMRAKISKLESDNTAAAKDAEIQTLKGTVESLQERLKEQNQASAKATVDAAVAAGKLAAKDEALRAKWVELIASDAGKAELLNAMPASHVLDTVVSGKGGQSPPVGAAGHEFIVAARKTAEAMGIPETEAQTIVAAKQPKLYEAYRESLG